MKRLSKLCYGIGVGCLGIALLGCNDAPIGADFADNYAALGALVIPSNVQVGFFDIADPDDSSIAFDLTGKGESISSTEVLVSFNGEGETTFSTVSAIPSTVNVSMNDVLAAIGKTVDEVEVGDAVRFAFRVTTQSGEFRSNRTLRVPFSCFSDLGGTYNYVSTNFQAITGNCPTDPVTGTVTWTDQGGGVYLTSDLGFGQYGTTCWNDAPATSGNAKFSDVCNKITSAGTDQYGLTYTYTITAVNGPNLSISWFNDYQDSGDVVLTRTDGKDWPPLYTN